MTRDSDGDGFTNRQERQGIYVGHGSGVTDSAWVETDPYSTDTDGDGIPDDEEISGRGPVSKGNYWILHTHPATPDTDGDRLTDYEETDIWEAADPTKADTDGDGFDDFVDREIATPNDASPPTIDVLPVDRWEGPRHERVGYREESGVSHVAYNEGLVFNVTDESAIESVSVRAYYDPPLVRAGWINVSDDRIQREVFSSAATGQLHAQYRIDLPRHNLSPPEHYELRVTDVHGYGYTMRIDPYAPDADVAKGASLQAVPVVGGVAARNARLTGQIATNGWRLSKTSIATAALTVSAEVGFRFADYYRPETAKATRTLAITSATVVPETDVARRYDVSGTDVTLPTGYVATENGHVRGFGLAYLATVWGVTEQRAKTAIGNAIDDGAIGDGRYVIDDGFVPEEAAILGIISGVLLAASDGYALDDCQEVVWLDNPNKDAYDPDNAGPEHAVREEKPINSLDRIKKLLENNVVRILEGSQRYYVIKVGTNRFITVVAQPLSEASSVGGHLLYTLLTGSDGGFYKSIKDAIDDVRDRETSTETVYNPETDSGC